MYMYISTPYQKSALGPTRDRSWPSQDIVITNIVWCIAYTWEVGRGVLIPFNHRAIVLHPDGQCRWAGGMKGWLIRALASK